MKRAFQFGLLVAGGAMFAGGALLFLCLVASTLTNAPMCKHPEYPQQQEQSQKAPWTHLPSWATAPFLGFTNANRLPDIKRFIHKDFPLWAVCDTATLREHQCDVVVDDSLVHRCTAAKEACHEAGDSGSRRPRIDDEKSHLEHRL